MSKRPGDDEDDDEDDDGADNDGPIMLLRLPLSLDPPPLGLKSTCST